jgi:putative ABC transport system substrate-binding protein
VKRREFVGLIGAAAAWPITARGQKDQVRRVAVLVPLPASDPIFRRNMETFTAVMKGAGWIEGRNLDMRIVSIIGSGKSPADAAADVLAGSPEAVIAVTPVAADPLHRQTKSVPLIFVVGWFNPVEKGFVAAINQPGGNMTGITDLEPSLGGKWVQLLKQIAPGIERAGILYNPDEGSISAPVLKAIKESAARVAVDLVDLPLRKEEEIERVIATLANDPSGGLICPSDVFTTAHRTKIIAEANDRRIPTMFPYRYYAADGGLAAYSPNQPSEFGQAAYYVDRILQGETPAHLPVQTPNKFELVINLTTAKALGIAIPASMLSLADELIE